MTGSPMRKFMIVTPSEKRGYYEVGLADGIWPWEHHATCRTMELANHLCTVLAMHYRVRAHLMTSELAESLMKGSTG